MHNQLPVRNPRTLLLLLAAALLALLTTACSDGGAATSTTGAGTSVAVATSGAVAAAAAFPQTGTVLADSTPRASAEVVSTATGRAASGAPVSPTPEEDASPAPVATSAASAGAFPLHSFLPAGGRQRVIALDPGHGGDEVGSAGAGVTEKDMNLDIARRLKTLLEADGYQVILTRDSDRRATPLPQFAVPGNWPVTRGDLQARLDIANAAAADVFISIHNNGSGDARQAGTEVWYDAKRPFGVYNLALAQSLLDSLVGAIRAAGYPTVNRGLQEDTYFRVRNGQAFPIFVLGPPRGGSTVTRAGAMPAALGETLFLSNPFEAQFLAREDIRAAIARGYRDGLRRYFARIDDGTLAPPAAGYPAETPNIFTGAGPGEQTGR